MTPHRAFVGTAQSPVVTVDDMTGDIRPVVDIAAALAPFPAIRGSYYPGVRRVITDADRDAMAYVNRLLEAAAPFIGGGFDADRFDLIEASFSMVTTRPDRLAPAQRAPHFDSTDPAYLAVMHYLADTPGTAFYRQNATGIECVTDANRSQFVAQARRESEGCSGYIAATNDAFEQIGTVRGIADRLAIYQGCLLHSGIVTPDLTLSDDPRVGRLTTNIFVQVRR